MSLTDEIYRELQDGLEKGNLGWQQFVAKYSNSKGPLYNAIARFFSEVGPKVAALKEENSRVQRELDQAELTLNSLDQKRKEAESDIASLEEKEDVLRGQVETLEPELEKKSELVKCLAELEKLGFNTEKLNLLRDTLRQTGEKHGLSSEETVNKFFGYLKDYGQVLEAEIQLQGLQTRIGTRKLEVEKWQAKGEALRRKHADLKEAIEAVSAFKAKNIKESEIITWHRILSHLQTASEFADSLTRYGDMTRLLEARREEAKSYERRLAKTQSQVETLEKERVKIEGAIDTLKVTGIKEIEEMADVALKQQRIVVAGEIKETQSIYRKFRSEFNHFSTQIEALTKKTYEIGQEYERKRQELQKYDGIKDVLESHAAAPETKNELPRQS